MSERYQRAAVAAGDNAVYAPVPSAGPSPADRPGQRGMGHRDRTPRGPPRCLRWGLGRGLTRDRAGADKATMGGSPERGTTWRGWSSQSAARPSSVTSAALPSQASVRSRTFPKTRSWFALGAPLELLSPLSVLRILFALDMVTWPIEGLVLRWPTHNLGWLIGATLIAAAVWVALRSARVVSRRWCHLLTLLANVLVITLAYSGTTLGPVLAAVVFLVPVASFVALFLGWRADPGPSGLCDGRVRAGARRPAPCRRRPCSWTPWRR